MNRSRPWPLYLIAAPAAVAIWSGWVGLGGMCGFGVIHPLPGIWDSVTINTAITLPVGVESYGAYAMHAWLARTGISDRARGFARKSVFAAFGLGCLGQVAFHLMAAAGWARAPWYVVMLVACLPVVTLGLGVALAHLLQAPERASAPAVKPKSAPVALTPAPVSAPAEDLTTEARALTLLDEDPSLRGPRMGAELARRLGVHPSHGRRLHKQLTAHERSVKER